MNKKIARLRRARKTRARIADLKMVRLCVFRTNSHIYAQIISAEGDRVLASASTAERAKTIGVERVAFDRSGFQYHGRVKALAEAARENGLSF